jgi:hypothetical protein
MTSADPPIQGRCGIASDLSAKMFALTVFAKSCKLFVELDVCMSLAENINS